MPFRLTSEEENLIRKMRAEKAAAEKLAAIQFPISSLESLSAEEKIEKFEDIYKVALLIWNETKDTSRFDDCQFHCFEKVLEVLVPKNKTKKEFWDAFNKLCS